MHTTTITKKVSHKFEAGDRVVEMVDGRQFVIDDVVVGDDDITYTMSTPCGIQTWTNRKVDDIDARYRLLPTPKFPVGTIIKGRSYTARVVDTRVADGDVEYALESLDPTTLRPLADDWRKNRWFGSWGDIEKKTLLLDPDRASDLQFIDTFNSGDIIHRGDNYLEVVGPEIADGWLHLRVRYRDPKDPTKPHAFMDKEGGYTFRASAFENFKKVSTVAAELAKAKAKAKAKDPEKYRFYVDVSGFSESGGHRERPTLADTITATVKSAGYTVDGFATYDYAPKA